jgi:hypothetical protein
VEAEAGEAEIDRQPLDPVAAIIEQAGLIGDRGRHDLADHVHHDGPLVQEPEVEQVKPERAEGDRSVGPEADVAIGVEVEAVERLGQGGRVRVEGRAGEVAGAPHHVLVAERADRRRPAGLGERGSGEEGREPVEERAAGRRRHGGPGKRCERERRRGMDRPRPGSGRSPKSRAEGVAMIGKGS